MLQGYSLQVKSMNNKNKMIKTVYRTERLRFIYIIVLISIFSSFSLALDDYKPYLHNPTVPAHQTLGLLGSYKTDLWPGAATYSYPIEVSRGTNGLQPVLFLYYNHQQTSQRSSIVGTGWTLSQNQITRNANYSFKNASDDGFRISLNGEAYNLIYDSSDGRYHTETESYLNIKKLSGANNTNKEYWVVKTKDGTTYRFGYNQDSELVSNSYNYTVKWSLDRIDDIHSNKVFYSYLENPYTNDLGAVYPYKIEYNNDKTRVIDFVLESNDRPDRILAYEDGNKIRESRRIKEIRINANSVLVRRYVLNYTSIEPYTKSLLSSITLYGNDNTTSLPPVRFSYNNVTKGWQQDDTFIFPPSPYQCGSTGSDYGCRHFDLNKDGLIDLMHIDGLNPHRNATWINNGSGWVRDDSWNALDNIVNRNQDDTGLRFVDFNGDGLVDIVKGDGSSRKSWQNNGSGWVQNNTWNLPTNANPVDTSSNIFERGVRFEDFNGDGLIDILSATDDWSYAWINNRNGWTSDNSWRVPTSAYFITYPSGVDEGVRLVDFNGDGLIDILKGKGTSRDAWINNGSGWIQDTNWLVPSNAYFSNSATGKDEGVRLADVNGDGLADLLKGKGNNESSWINNGSGWVRDDSWNIPARADFVRSGGGNVGVRLVDVNGDGAVDILNSGDNEITFTNKAVKPYLLRKISNNLGGSDIIEYVRSSLLDNKGTDNLSDIGFNLWVADTISRDDGMNNTYSTHYQYSGGLYDYLKKEYRGFNKISEIQHNLSVTKHWFYQNDSLKGKKFKTEIFDNEGKVYYTTENFYSSILSNGHTEINLIKKKDYIYDGVYDSPKVVEEQYSYDSYGNILSINHLGFNNTLNDEKFVYLEYLYNTTAWIVSSIKHYMVYNFNNSTKIKEVFLRYDNLSYDSIPTKGDLTWIEEWLNGGSNPITKYSYNAYGNIIEEVDSRGYKTKYNYGIRDSTYTYIDQMINSKNQILNYWYDFGTGNILSEVDSNGYTKNYTYNFIGMINKEILEGDSLVYPTKEYQYTFDGITPEKIKVIEREISNQNSTIEYYYFYDGFGNLIQTKSESENSKQIVTNLFYDANRNIVKQSIPYILNSTEEFQNQTINISNTYYNYDVLQRVIGIINPDNTKKNITFFRSRIIDTNENGNIRIYYLDAYQNIVKVIEYTSDNYFVTLYSYNPLGNILQINDSHGNVYTYYYDTLNRKVREDNPDFGSWLYQYDSVGNMIKQTYSNGKNVSITYDELNRIATENSSDNIITYYYDKINGTLSSITTKDLITNYSYDKRLRKILEVKNIGGKVLTKSWAYDSSDNIRTETMPDGSVITYNYSPQGSIKQISGIVQSISYNELNKPTKLSYNNNLDTDITYSNNSYRLTRIKTGDKQDIEYTYDISGNIIKIKDNINKYNESMSYDKLDRLTAINKTGNNKYSMGYVYNSIGNIIQIISDELSNISLYYSSSNPIHSPKSMVRCAIVDIESFNESYSNSGRKVWEIILKNNNQNNISLINWVISGGDETIISTQPFSLEKNESILTYVGQNLSVGNNYSLTLRLNINGCPSGSKTIKVVT